MSAGLEPRGREDAVVAAAGAADRVLVLDTGIRRVVEGAGQRWPAGHPPPGRGVRTIVAGVTFVFLRRVRITKEEVAHWDGTTLAATRKARAAEEVRGARAVGAGRGRGPWARVRGRARVRGWDVHLRRVGHGPQWAPPLSGGFPPPHTFGCGHLEQSNPDAGGHGPSERDTGGGTLSPPARPALPAPKGGGPV
jgi:hypothetical protein